MTTYTEQEFEEEFMKENKYTAHLPAYIREYPKFLKLLIMFSNYIQLCCDDLEYILSQLNLSTAHGAMLEKIAERLDITIEKPIVNGVVNQSLYEQMLKIAILGNGLKRNSKADRDSLSKLPDVFNSISKVEIKDYGVLNVQQQNKTPMLINVRVTGKNDTWNSDLLEKYVLPNITGVRMIINYLIDNNNYFGFDINTVVNIIGDIVMTTEQVTQEALNSRAEELGYSLANNKLMTGITLRDSDNNCWVYMKSENTWVNQGQVENGTVVVDPNLGYSIQGWDKGRWVDTTIIE